MTGFELYVSAEQKKQRLIKYLHFYRYSM